MNLENNYVMYLDIICSKNFIPFLFRCVAISCLMRNNKIDVGITRDLRNVVNSSPFFVPEATKFVNKSLTEMCRKDKFSASFEHKVVLPLPGPPTTHIINRPLSFSF